MSESDIWSVSTLANAVKRSIESGYGEVRVKGEVGKVTRHASGHIYFDLKDETAVLHGAWFGAAKRADSKVLEMGAEVVVKGRLTTYPARSEYQIIASAVELAGVGALLKLIEERKKKLTAEGLFDAARKKPLPFLPRRIGIITSPTGAVIHDILHRLQDRFMPHVLLWPVKVQGDGAAEEVRAALEGFNSAPPHLKPDVLIVARGGGSVEDLMAFNDEALVRAVAASHIPIITAIGHETDTTLVDFAADQRAPTPTAAAEMAVPVVADLRFTLADYARRLRQAPYNIIKHRQAELDAVRRGLPRPEALLEAAWQRLDDKDGALTRATQNYVGKQQLRLSRQQLRHPRELIASSGIKLVAVARALTQSMKPQLQQREQKLARLDGMLEALSYKGVLARGYAVALDAAGHPITRALPTPEITAIQFADGVVRIKKSP